MLLFRLAMLRLPQSVFGSVSFPSEIADTFIERLYSFACLSQNESALQQGQSSKNLEE